MREILFRGKTEAGKWVEGFLIGRYDPTQKENIIKNAFIDNGTCFYSPEKVIPETVGQYTGMNDKNDKRIFEGDIVKHENDIGKVCYSDSFAKFRVVYNLLSGNWFDFEGEECYPIALECEVIGNIHDNPELLKGGNI